MAVFEKTGMYLVSENEDAGQATVTLRGSGSDVVLKFGLPGANTGAWQEAPFAAGKTYHVTVEEEVS